MMTAEEVRSRYRQLRGEPKRRESARQFLDIERGGSAPAEAERNALPLALRLKTGQYSDKQKQDRKGD
jgi:hypothetical protein